MTTEHMKPGAQAQVEFDRMTVERFRETFPKARWDDVAKAWWVPGKTADRRIARWRALEQTKADIYADAKFSACRFCRQRFGLAVAIKLAFHWR